MWNIIDLRKPTTNCRYGNNRREVVIIKYVLYTKTKNVFLNISIKVLLLKSGGDQKVREVVMSLFFYIIRRNSIL
jgi:hypothetical protein